MQAVTPVVTLNTQQMEFISSSPRFILAVYLCINIFISQDLMSQYSEFSWIREVWCFPSHQGTELVWIDPVIKCSTFLVTILHCGEYIVTTPTNKRKRFRLFADRESQRTTLLIITYIQTCLYFPNSHPHDHDVSSKNIKYVFSITFSYTSNVSFIFLIS